MMAVLFNNFRKKLARRLLSGVVALAVLAGCALPQSLQAFAYDSSNTLNGDKYIEFHPNDLEIKNSATGSYEAMHDGMNVDDNSDLRFTFSWNLKSEFEKEIVDGEFPVTFEIDLSDELGNIKLGTQLTPQEIDVGDDCKISYTYDGTKMWITIEDKGYKTKDFKGRGTLYANIDVEEAEENPEGNLDLQFFGKTIKTVYTPWTNKMTTTKTQTGTHYENGKYYADFSVEVWSDKVDMYDVKLNDIFEYGDDKFYANDVLHNVKVKYPDGIEKEIGDQSADDPIELSEDLNTSQRAVVTYSIEIAPENNGKYSENKIEATANDDEILSKSSAWGSANLPAAGKSGQLVEGTEDTIEWTITVSLNMLNDEGIPDDVKTFTVTDTPGNGIDEESFAAAMKELGATDNGDGSYKIPREKFNFENGSYTLKYQTKISKELMESASNKHIRNNAKATFPKFTQDSYTTNNAEANVTIKGETVGEIDKELLDFKDGRYDWSVVVTIPDTDVAALKISDSTISPENWNGQYLTHNVDLSTLKIDGKPYSEVCKERQWHDVDQDPYCEVGNGTLSFELSEEFLESFGGKTVTVTYQTQAVDKNGVPVTDPDPSLYVYNKASFELKLTGETDSETGSDEYTKVPKFTVNKKDYTGGYSNLDTSSLTNPITWDLQISGLKSVDECIKVGDVLTIIDTLPEGYELSQYQWAVSRDEYNANELSDVGKDITADIEKNDSGDVVTFEVTVTEEMINKLKTYQQNGKWYLWIIYSTGMKKDYDIEFSMKYYDPDKLYHDVENIADVYLGDEKIANDVSAKHQLPVDDMGILDKSSIENYVNDGSGSKRLAPKEEMVDGKMRSYVEYSVKINENGLIIGGTDEDGNALLEELTAIDKMGYGLTFGGIIDGIEPERVTVSKNRKIVQFHLKNQQSYEITYKAYIDQADPGEKVTDADERFGNTVTLNGQPSVSSSRNTTLAASVYQALFTASADNDNKYITVKGTKIWKDTEGITLPERITLTLIKKDAKTGEPLPDGELTYVIGKEPDLDCDIYYTEENGDWQFTIPRLVTADTSGTYSYDVTEIAIDGYTVTYENNTDLSNAPENKEDTEDIVIMPVTITNTHTEEAPKTTEITVNKVWEDNNDKIGVRPQSVTVQLMQNGKAYGDTVELNADNGWSHKFEELPADAEYTVTETAVDNYNVKYSPLTEGKITVTNTIDYSKFTTSVSGTKTWTDNNNKLGARPAKLKITLLADGESYQDKDINAAGGVWSYEFTDLPMYDSEGNEIVYTVKEEAVAGYTSVQTGNNFENTVITSEVSVMKVDENGTPVVGAQLYILDGGKVIDSWKSDGNAHNVQLIPGKEYTLRETSAPSGYSKADDKTFTVNTDGTVTEVTMVDESITVVTKVKISKQDITTKEEIEGAQLELYDSKGALVESWTSGKEPHYLEGVLKAGETYKLVEKTAPDGYTVAEEITFKVNDDGEVQTVEMFDDTTKVKISKQDITTKEELAGAQLELYDSKGALVDSWTSGKEPHYLEGVLKAGETYKLVEKTAPDGYTVAEDVTFVVNDDGKVQTVVMFDDTTKVKISKQDITTKEELAGAQLELYDSTGALVDSWTSGKEPHYLEGVLKAGETYKLVEKTAPDGYTVAEDVTFVVNDDGKVQTVEMFDERIKTDDNNVSGGGSNNDSGSGTSSGSGSNNAPKTGESTDTLVIAVMMLLAYAVTDVIVKRKRE